MSPTHADRSLGSKGIVETNGLTDGRTRPIALPSPLSYTVGTRLVTVHSHETTVAAKHMATVRPPAALSAELIGNGRDNNLSYGASQTNLTAYVTPTDRRLS